MLSGGVQQAGQLMVSEKPQNGAQHDVQIRRASTPTNGDRTWEKGFLKALAKAGTVTAACDAVGIDRTTSYKARDVDPEFAARWSEAVERCSDRLEQLAIARANNLEDPKGATLLIFLLKGLKPEKYAERYNMRHEGGESFGRDAALIQARILEVSRQRQAAGRGLPDGN